MGHGAIWAWRARRRYWPDGGVAHENLSEVEGRLAGRAPDTGAGFFARAPGFRRPPPLPQISLDSEVWFTGRAHDGRPAAQHATPMNAVLVKIFATALALSQVTTRPDAVKTEFDPVRDRDEVVQLLRDGCGHVRKAFDIEDINLDDLITTAMDDPQAAAGIKSFRGLEFNNLQAAYRQFCRNEPVDGAMFDIAEVVDFYNKAVADLPDHTRLKGLRLSGVSTVLDTRGERFTDVFEPDQRRIWVPIDRIPEHVRRAFVAAEDKRFFQHHGVDERGLIRAFVSNLAQPRRPQGGSTITQQVAKNLLVGDDVTYERKIREVIVASRVERTLGKADILELYLNSIYLGRGSWGVELAARSYFGKS